MTSPRSRDDRSEQALAWRKLYGTRRWKAVRLAQLAAHPLCAMCEKASRITAATVCDHIDKSSKNTEQGFFAGPFQSLCDDPRYRCHSSTKQQQETIGYSTAVGADGLPVDPNHPWNTGR